MVQALSNDLRERVIRSVHAGQSCRSAARVFGISPATAIRWVAQWRQTGRIDPFPQGGDNRSHKLEAYGDEILTLINKTPHITLAEIAAHLHEIYGVKASQSSIWRLLDRRGWTYKKNRPRC